ncbi:MAG: metallophosphoesterase family protein [Acidimicrobiia bacterium]|nr:metallophosphoesterase family protein [Acidimicrobiia bacterium]
MRYVVLSDIHSNLEALEAVLAEARPEPGDGVLVLGDLVGYGPDPNAVVTRLRELQPLAVIRGNHDKVASGLEPATRFNHHARTAVAWTADVLTPDSRHYLSELPAGPVAIDDVVEICHGTPFDEDVYVFDDLDAARALRSARRRVCLFGHTHLAAAFRLADGGVRAVVPRRTAAFRVDVGGGRWIVNCGAVGQPRDGDWRAAWGEVDTLCGRVTIHRVEYDVEATQAKMVAAGLPELLVERLKLGR